MTIGFIGFGEAGSTIASGLRSVGCERPVAYDINRHDPSRGPLIERRAADGGTTLVESSAELPQVVLGPTLGGAAADRAKYLRLSPR